MKRALFATLATLALAACATEPTRYQPAASPHAVGFTEMRIEPGRYRIVFQGGPGAPMEQVSDYALLHAADLALSQGYDWFRVIDRETHETGYSGSSLSFGVGGASFGHHSATGVGVSSGIPLGGGVSLATTMEVLMGKGPRPAGEDVYDARGVRATVGPRAGAPAG
jgi:hypothetical protein